MGSLYQVSFWTYEDKFILFTERNFQGDTEVATRGVL